MSARTAAAATHPAAGSTDHTRQHRARGNAFVRAEEAFGITKGDASVLYVEKGFLRFYHDTRAFFWVLSGSDLLVVAHTSVQNLIQQHLRQPQRRTRTATHARAHLTQSTAHHTRSDETKRVGGLGRKGE